MKVTARARHSGSSYHRPHSLICTLRPSAFVSPCCTSNEPDPCPALLPMTSGMTVANLTSPRACACALAWHVLHLNTVPLPLASPHLASMSTHLHTLHPTFPASLFMGATPHSLKCRASPAPTSHSGPAISISAHHAWHCCEGSL